MVENLLPHVPSRLAPDRNMRRRSRYYATLPDGVVVGKTITTDTAECRYDQGQNHNQMKHCHLLLCGSWVARLETNLQRGNRHQQKDVLPFIICDAGTDPADGSQHLSGVGTVRLRNTSTTDELEPKQKETFRRHRGNEAGAIAIDSAISPCTRVLRHRSASVRRSISCPRG
jgi:hypothetical protein